MPPKKKRKPDSRQPTLFSVLGKNDTDLNKAHVQVEDAESQNPIEKS